MRALTIEERVLSRILEADTYMGPTPDAGGAAGLGGLGSPSVVPGPGEEPFVPLWRRRRRRGVEEASKRQRRARGQLTRRDFMRLNALAGTGLGGVIGLGLGGFKGQALGHVIGGAAGSLYGLHKYKKKNRRER